MRGQKPSALGACIGAVVGLVAITPAAGYVSVGESIFIGTVRQRRQNLVVHWKNASTLDDTLDVFPCHGVGGMVGMLMTGIFAKDVGLTSGHATTFLVHCCALVFVAAFSFFGSWILYKFTDLIIPLRVSEEQEEIGLDLSQHGEVMQGEMAIRRAAAGVRQDRVTTKSETEAQKTLRLRSAVLRMSDPRSGRPTRSGASAIASSI